MKDLSDIGNDVELIPAEEPPELLPLAFADEESSALLLQLPDGHVLRLAHAEPGTVVEVASWTGAGRPGPQTSRLMVGIGFESPNSDTTGGAVSAGTSIESDQPHVVTVWPTTRYRRWARPVMWAAGIATIIITLVFSPLTAVRPTSGSSVGLGATDNSIVVVVPVSQVSAGQNVVAYLDDAHKSSVLGRVNQVQGDAVLIQTDRAFAQTKVSRIVGRVLFVVPWVGRALRR